MAGWPAFCSGSVKFPQSCGSPPPSQILNSAPSGLREAAADSGLPQKLEDGKLHGGLVTIGNNTSLFLIDQIGTQTGWRCHDGTTTGHSLSQRDAETLVVGWEEEDRCERQ